MNALRAARRVPTAPKTLTPSDTSLEPAPAPVGAQVTTQGTIIDTVAGYEIREDHEGVYIAPNAPDDALLAMLRRTIERHGSTLSTHGPDDFQLRLAKVAGINHLSVCFEDAAIEQARQAARAAAPVPISKAALQYIAERNSKRDRISDIAFHRLWQAADAGELEFAGLRVVENQNLLLLSNGNETLVLPITPQQRRQLAPQPRGTRLMVSTEVVIQTPVQGLER
jgi:hypothetical protein